MALITAQSVVATGLAPVYSTPTASDTFLPDDGLVLHVKNANASATNVTVVDGGATAAGNPGTAAAVSVPATTGDRMIAVSRAAVNPATGLITVTYSVTASVTAALIRR